MKKLIEFDEKLEKEIQDHANKHHNGVFVESVRSILSDHFGIDCVRVRRRGRPTKTRLGN